MIKPTLPRHRVLICGSRDWTNRGAIVSALLSIGPENIECVIEGECRGADRLGRVVARDLEISVMKFPADWVTYKKAAGPIRNKQMLDEGKPTIVLAFHKDLKNSRGTADMLRQARKAGVSVVVIDA